MTTPLKRELPPARGQYLAYLDIPRPCGAVDLDAVRAKMATEIAPGARADIAPARERKSVRRRVWHALTQPASRQGGIRKWQ